MNISTGTILLIYLYIYKLNLKQLTKRIEISSIFHCKKLGIMSTSIQKASTLGHLVAYSLSLDLERLYIQTINPYNRHPSNINIEHFVFITIGQ